MSQIRLSASSIRDYLTCGQKYRLKYIAGLDPDVSVEALRIGGAWAKMHEYYEKSLASHHMKNEAQAEACQLLDKIYNNIPPGYDAKEWEAEREMLRRSFIVYQEVYKDSDFNVIETEGKHEFPLIHPDTGMAIPERDAVCVVKLDKFVRDSAGTPCVLEMKSTTREITPGSDYWQSLRLDIQISFYARWAKLAEGEIGPTIYDVWRRPLLRLKKDEIVAEYADRVEEKLRANPAEHFQRHEIVRTDKDLEMFDRELWNVYQQMKETIRRDLWVSNTSQCISFMGKCPYHSICSREGAERTVREQLTPVGFKKREIK